MVVAATILSLIMFFVLKEAKMKIAIVQVTALDATILVLGNSPYFPVIRSVEEPSDPNDLRSHRYDRFGRRNV